MKSFPASAAFRARRESQRVYTYLLLGCVLLVMSVLVLLVLLACDLRRRHAYVRRRWYESRLHIAYDRVQAYKLEHDPPIAGKSWAAPVRKSEVDPVPHVEAPDVATRRVPTEPTPTAVGQRD
ncbi:MAG: hypothetical protein ACKVX7_01925 [Planctomycetota bacterium]